MHYKNIKEHIIIFNYLLKGIETQETHERRRVE